MAVAVLVESTKCSRETYERIRRRLGSRKPAGGIFHIAGPSPNGGWRVVEVWESEEDADRLWAHETNLKKSGIDLTQIAVDDKIFTDGRVEVYFLPLGGSSHHVIQLTQPQLEPPREFTLEVLPLTGEIRMHDGLFLREPVDEGDFRRGRARGAPASRWPRWRSPC